MAEYDWKIFDCQTCGACCAHYKAVDVSIGDANYRWLADNGYLETFDASKYSPHAGESPAKSQIQFRMKMSEADRCAALVGTVGVDAVCSIYENRPQSCRNYEIDTPRCRTARYMEIPRVLDVELPKSKIDPEAVSRLLKLLD